MGLTPHEKLRKIVPRYKHLSDTVSLDELDELVSKHDCVEFTAEPRVYKQLMMTARTYQRLKSTDGLRYFVIDGLGKGHITIKWLLVD